MSLQQQINLKTKELKKFILDQLVEYIDPQWWRLFEYSRNKRGIFAHHAHDIPSVRDLKAFLNILTALEIITEKVPVDTERYALRAVKYATKIQTAVNTRLNTLYAMIELRRNFRIMMSTGSVLSYYLAPLKEMTLKRIIPKLMTYFKQLSDLCTSANIQNACEFFIQQIMHLEQYQQKYLYAKRKLLKTEKKEEIGEKKEHFVTSLVKGQEFYLRKFYKDKFPLYFDKSLSEKERKELEKKIITSKSQTPLSFQQSIYEIYDFFSEDTVTKEESKEEKKDLKANLRTYDYFPEFKVEANETVKNIKKLANSVIGFKKVLDDYEAYDKANKMTGAYWIYQFILHLKQAYSFLDQFDYKEILAEKTNPLAEYIKYLLKQFDKLLEKITCVLDEFEVENGLKEKSLLKHVEALLNRYNQVTHELQIPIDYLNQRNLYLKSRMQSRKQQLQNIDHQIEELTIFISHQRFAPKSLPPDITYKMYAFILKYGENISIDRNFLKTYKQALLSSLDLKPSFKADILNSIRPSHYTWHRKMCTAFETMRSYLLRQRTFVHHRLQTLRAEHLLYPFEYFRWDIIYKAEPLPLILEALRKRCTELEEEKNNLSISLATSDKKSDQNVRLENELCSKIKEHGLFKNAVQDYEKKKDLDILRQLRSEPVVSPASVRLLKEAEDVLETKSPRRLR